MCLRTAQKKDEVRTNLTMKVSLGVHNDKDLSKAEALLC